MIQPGLERIAQLLATTKLRWQPIHVAGTNGKGSVCAYITSMLRRANLRTGRFTSPHLIDRYDCITVDDLPIPADELRPVQKTVDRRNDEHRIDASEFEMLTATALQLFNRMDVQVGVVECGMGGLHDATNIIEDPLVSVITSISMDHQQWLGDSLEQIAGHKAGIIKHGRPVVVAGSNPPAVLDVVDRVASDKQTKAVRAYPSDCARLCHDFTPPSDVAAENMSLALNAVTVALGQFASNRSGVPLLGPLSERAQSGDLDSLTTTERMTRSLSPAMLTAPLPGRLQRISIREITGRSADVLLDGAHNPAAWKALSDHVFRNQRDGKDDSPVTWLVGMSHKCVVPDVMLNELVRRNDRVIVVEFGPVDGMPWVKAMPSADFKPEVLRHKPECFHRCGQDVRGALCKAAEVAEGGPMVVAGSLYLVGDVLRLLRDSDHMSLS